MVTLFIFLEHQRLQLYPDFVFFRPIIPVHKCIDYQIYFAL